MNGIKKTGIILFALILVLFQLQGFSQKASAQPLDNAVTISVQDQDGNNVLKLKAVNITKDETAFDVIKKVDKNLKYSVDPNYGPFIKGINGLTPKDPAYWGFFVNGVDPGVGASSYKVNPGDDLLFKVVNWPYPMIYATVSITGTNVPAKYQNKKVEVVDGASAYDAIKQAYKDSMLVAPIDSQYFAYIANIDNMVRDGHTFMVDINNKAADKGVSTTKVNNGDKITLKLTGTATENGENINTDKGKTAHQTNVAKVPSITKTALKKNISLTSNYILRNGGVNDFYGAMAFRQAGIKIPQSYIDSLAKDLRDNNGQYRNVTDYEKVALGVTAAGGNATNFVGYNLINSIYNNERMTNQGNNGPVYALLAMDSGKYKVPSDAKWTREKLVDYLLKNQLKDGSWALFGNTGSPDMTGMTLSALAPYKSDAKVKTAVKQATKYLSSKQNKNGGYGVESNGGDSSESTAQVIIGLTAAGIDPAGSQFTKNGIDLVKHLLDFQQKDGGFSHLQSDKNSNLMATAQAFLALTSYQNYLNAKGSTLQVNNSGITVHPSANGTGGVLPNTATNDYNVVVIGLAIILIGSLVLLYYRKRRA